MTAAATTLFPARQVITMEPNSPDATAVAVSGDRVIAVGSLAELRAGGDQVSTVVDETFADAVVCPGFIDQHLHPVLGATTLATEVIAPEQWAVGGRTFPAANSQDAYRQALRNAERGLIDPQSWLFSWGYHPLWHGHLDRAVLDEVSRARPVAVWHRSCHEWFLNSTAIEELGITREQMTGHDRASTMVDLDGGHWWETGMNLLLPKLAPVSMNADRMTAGLRQLVGYLHSTGVTAFNEPGIMWDLEPWQLYQQILGAEDTPFLSTFLVDARSQADAGMDPADAVADAEAQVARACSGKVRLLPKQVKLFADGAIISQLMQMKDPYLDDVGRPDPHHHGEWMMQPNVFRAFAKVYWDAGWQLHVHVNGLEIQGRP
jgi:predicted amidohydrolase YtcJ